MSRLADLVRELFGSDPLPRGVFVPQKTAHDLTSLSLESPESGWGRPRDESQTNESAQFAYFASHDLQEPLRMIAGYLQLLERRYKDKLDEEALEFIRYAVDGAARMKGMIQDLLRLSHAGTQAADFRGVPTSVLFEAACSNLAASIRETGAWITADPLPVLVADAGLLTQVFQNLIGNALKFHPKGAQPQIHVSAARDRDEWVFAVRDNGIGIEPQHLDRIFRVFERLRGVDEYAGSGIGLAIAQKIVERHGGRIWAESKPGEGSVFYFSIPAIPEPARAKAAASSRL